MRISTLLYSLAYLHNAVQVFGAVFYVSTSVGKPDANGTAPQYASSNLTSILLRAPSQSAILLCRGDVFIGPFVSEKQVSFLSYVCNESHRNTQPTITSSVPVKSPTFEKGPNNQTIWVYDVSGFMKSGQLIGNVYVDGQEYMVARWPNLLNPKVRIGTSKSEFQFMKKKSTNSFIFSDETLKKGTTYWIGATVRYRPMSWGNDRRVVYDYNPTNKSHLTTRPTYFPSWYKQDRFGYYLENIFGELDAPGEFYYDTQNRKLYLIPMEGANPKRFSQVDTNYGTWVLPTSNQTSSDFLFEGYNDACLTLKANSTYVGGISVTKCMNGILSRAQNTTILGSSISFTINSAIRINTGIVANGSVRSSLVYGIMGGTEISRMHVSGIGLTTGYSSAPGSVYSNGIWCKNCTVKHCIVQKTGYIGIYPDNFAVVRDNVLDRNLLGFGDGGSIYGFNRKNVTIRNNYLGRVPGNFVSAHVLDPPDGYVALASVYPDAGSMGWTIQGNMMNPGGNLSRCLNTGDGKYHDVVNNYCVGGVMTILDGSSATTGLRLENNTFVPSRGADGPAFQMKFWNVSNGAGVSFKGNKFTRKTLDEQWNPVKFELNSFQYDANKNIINRTGKYPERYMVERSIECARIATSYGFVATPAWNSNTCIQQFCQKLNATIIARPDYQAVKIAYDEECAPKIYTEAECGKVHETYHITPYITVGTVSLRVLDVWYKSECQDKMCQYWVGRYKIRAANATKVLPSNIKPSWDHMKCGSKVKFFS